MQAYLTLKTRCLEWRWSPSQIASPLEGAWHHIGREGWLREVAPPSIHLLVAKFQQEAADLLSSWLIPLQ